MSTPKFIALTATSFLNMRFIRTIEITNKGAVIETDNGSKHTIPNDRLHGIIAAMDDLILGRAETKKRHLAQAQADAKK